MILWRPALRDTKRRFLLETAVNGRADFLVDIQPARFRIGGRQVRAGGPGASAGPRATQETAMKKSYFALRLQPSLMEETRKVANAEAVAVNQLIIPGDELAIRRPRRRASGPSGKRRRSGTR